MATPNFLELPNVRFPAGSSWAEEVAEYTYQLLRRLAPQWVAGLRAAPTNGPAEPVEDGAAVLEGAPDWVREAYAHARDSNEVGLSDAGARAFVARDCLLQALRRSNMNQAELARRLGKSATSISRIFKAPHRSRVTTLQAIAGVLQVDLADILDAKHT
jgi:hypothetical protein